MATNEANTAPDVGLTLTTITIGLVIGQIVAAVLGVLAISGEYSTGMIRSTLTAVPARLPVLAAKTIVMFGLVTVVGFLTLLTSWAVTFPLYAAEGLETGLTESGFLFALLGGAVYLGLTSVFGLGLGAILRSSAGGVAAVLGVILGLQILLPLAAFAVHEIYDLMPYTFDSAGRAMYSLPGNDALLETGPGWLVILAWTAVSLIGAAVLLRRRDA